MPLARQGDPVSGSDGPALGGAVSYRLRDLPGMHTRCSFIHRRGVLLDRRLGVVHDQRRQRLHDRRGRHDGDRAIGELGHLARHRHDVLVVREHDHRVGRTAIHGFEDLRGRRVHRLAAGDDVLHTEADEEPFQSVAHRDRDDAGGDVLDRRGTDLRLLTDPRLFFALLHLLVQVGDADLGGTTGDDAGLDGGADVVRVHVAVPDAVATDDDDRVAEVAPGLLELRDRVVRHVEEVHHLVSQLGDVVATVAVMEVRRDRHGGGHHLRRGDRPFGDDIEAGVEEELESQATRVDNPGIAEHRQQVGCAGHCGPRRVRSPFENVAQGCLAIRGYLLDGFGGDPHDREDRSLDRPEHCFVGGIGSAPQTGDHVGSRDRLEWRERVREAPQDLRQDHTRVPAGPHQRAVPDRLTDLLHVRAVGGQLLDDGFEGERHIGARIAVGHRVHVEAVQFFLMVAQRVAVRGDHTSQISRCE